MHKAVAVCTSFLACALAGVGAAALALGVLVVSYLRRG